MPAHFSVALDAVTGTGASAPIWALGLTRWMVHVDLTGSPTSFQVDLEGSVDGTTWSDMASSSSTSSTSEFGYAPAGTSFRAYPYVRVNINTLSGGSSPTATVTIIGTEG